MGLREKGLVTVLWYGMNYESNVATLLCVPVLMMDFP